MVQIKINFDAKKAQQLILSAKTAIKDFKTPLRTVERYQMKQIDKQFQTEGQHILGKKWEALRQNTIKQRLRQGYGAGPILTRSGRMRKAFKRNELTNNRLVIGNPTFYFKYHQQGGSKSDPRVMLAHSKKMINDVVKIFSDYLKSKLNG